MGGFYKGVHTYMYMFSKSDVIRPENKDNIKEIIGNDCYFGNNLDQIKRAIQYKRKAIFKGLSKVDDEFCYITVGKRNYKMFLPCDRVRYFNDDSVICE